ncbi:diguanylate cyclase domain-containing protein [Pelosinus sp. UFO1]|uniref:diguanylate cyclase domain-containing protein n=1 Tax=Pelosinus sp. UFO1 TaxID=484770 RepID=UPI0004D14AD8|nr:diguanylate cyclase [Pelosinus sp. UFO1]AIF53927.1 diguanylate cyclase with PAS/PAC and GAF sensor [Pelosinus sp. UFO1]
MNFIGWNALRITVTYICIGIMWILFSDKIIERVFSDPGIITLLSISKGWFFVLCTGWLLYGMVKQSHKILMEQNIALENLGEERLASEEELRQQLDELLSREQEIQKQNLVLGSLNETAMGLMNRLDSSELIKDIVESAARLVGTPHGYICLIDAPKGVYKRLVGIGEYNQDAGRTDRLIDGLVGEVYRTGESMIVDDYSTWNKRLKDSYFDQMHCTIQVPFKSEGRVFGTLGLSYAEPERKFTASEVDLLNRFAELTSIALDSTNLLTTYKNELKERRYAEKALEISQANYHAIFDTANDGIFVHDAKTYEIIDSNKKAQELYGLTHDEIILQGLDGLGNQESPYGRKEAREWLSRAAQGKPQLFEWIIKNKAGEHIWVEINLKYAKIGDDDRILAVVRDIRERKKRELELYKMQANNQALIDAMPDDMFLIKRNGTLIESKIKGQLPYYLLSDKVYKSVIEVFREGVSEEIMLAIEQAIIKETFQLYEFEVMVDQGQYHYEARILPSGKEEVLVIIRDVTDRKQIEEKLAYISLHDAMTGLYNRAYFEEEMKRRGNAREIPIGLIICDLDGLKLINDTLGHSMGDEVLKAVAQVLKKSFRPDDLIARIGGDEFAILLTTNSILALKTACSRMRTIIEEYNETSPKVPISLSMGFAVSKEMPTDVDALFKEADNYMYREKLHRHKSTKSAIVQALMSALEARDFITEGHGDRLKNLIVALAAAIGLPEQKLADLRLFAQFHDLGKVGIPDHILFKPSRLTVDETIVMRQHAEIGYRIARSAPDLEPIAEWILKHHEWWDGQGYPFGIQGDNIPIECRMLTIVDAYDAMTNDRPYRKAMKEHEALAELKGCAGTQFDPHLVNVFVNLVENE